MDGQGIRSLASFHRAVLNLAFGASIGRSTGHFYKKHFFVQRSCLIIRSDESAGRGP
jgi:hypothetical protein